MTTIVVIDGGRHRKISGYGALSRAIILALKRHSELDVTVEATDSSWDPDVPHRRELMEIPTLVDLKKATAALQIGSPTTAIKAAVPVLVYTQNALGELPQAWIEGLRKAAAVIVPGEFDARVFRRHFPRVYTCPQHVDPTIFKPVPRWREEGASELTFMFIGSYSYRKGVDLLVPAFIEAFHAGQPARLRLNCSAGFWNESVNDLLEKVRRLPAHLSIDSCIDVVSPEWMNRHINRVDCVVTLSRGEGWCMPLHEALLCGKPVIAPDSTAMGEALPLKGVRRVRTRERPIAEITNPLGKSMREFYGADGNVCYEPDFADAVAALRQVAAELPTFAAGAQEAGAEIQRRYSLEVLSERLQTAVYQTLSELGVGLTPRATAARTAPDPKKHEPPPVRVLPARTVLVSRGSWSEHHLTFPPFDARPFEVRLTFDAAAASGGGEVQLLLFRNGDRDNFRWFSVHRGALAELSSVTVDASWFAVVGTIALPTCDHLVVRVRASQGESTIVIAQQAVSASPVRSDPAPAPPGSRSCSSVSLLEHELAGQRELRSLRAPAEVGPGSGIASVTPGVGSPSGGQRVCIIARFPKSSTEEPLSGMRVRFDGWSTHAEVPAESVSASDEDSVVVYCTTPALPVRGAIKKAVPEGTVSYPQVVYVSLLLGTVTVGGGSYLYSDVVPAPGAAILLYPGCEQDLIPGWINLDRRPIMGAEGRAALWEFHSGFRFLRDDSVDAITVSHMLMYLPVPQHRLFLADCFRVLKRGGVLRITEDNANLRRADDSHYLVGPTSPVTARDALQAVGFDVFDQYPNTTKSVHAEIMRRRHMELWDDAMFSRSREAPIYFIEGVKPLRHYSICTFTAADPFSSEPQRLLERGQLAPTFIAGQVNDVDSRFVADPFLFRHDGHEFLFFESRTAPNACIGVARRAGLGWDYLGTALKEPFHLSFPVVFEHDGQIYMLPESGKIGELRLYRALDFPLSWELDSVLLAGMPCVDSSLFHHAGRWWLLCQIDKGLHLFVSVSLRGPYVSHPANPVVRDPRYSRPAGRVHVVDGQIFRLSQNCTRVYGETVALHRIAQLDEDHYAETLVADPFLQGPERGTVIAWNSKIHHMDVLSSTTKNEWLVVIDATDTDTVPRHSSRQLPNVG